MTNKRFLLIAALALFCIDMYGQKTPEELGKLTFETFKYKKLAVLDTLSPTAQQMVEILNAKYPENPLGKDTSFPRKYVHHNSGFKNKCIAFMEDTTYFNIDWKRARLLGVKFYERDLTPKADTSLPRYMVNYLDVTFISRQDTLLMSFKKIHSYRGTWKLGENVHFRNLADKERQ
jgi:hypothetical protein